MIQQQVLHPTRTIAILALSASVFLAAVGLSVLNTRVVRDPENPAFVGNTIPAVNTTTSTQVVRDPENPYWTGALISETSGAGVRGATQGLR